MYHRLTQFHDEKYTVLTVPRYNICDDNKYDNIFKDIKIYYV